MVSEHLPLNPFYGTPRFESTPAVPGLNTLILIQLEGLLNGLKASQVHIGTCYTILLESNKTLRYAMSPWDALPPVVVSPHASNIGGSLDVSFSLEQETGLFNMTWLHYRPRCKQPH